MYSRIDIAYELAEELRGQRLRVTLTPAPDPRHVGHMVRTVTEQNPEWYQRVWKTFGQMDRRLVADELRWVVEGVKRRRVYREIVDHAITDRIEYYESLPAPGLF